MEGNGVQLHCLHHYMMSADMSSAVSNKGKSSGLGETKYFQYDTSTRTLMFLYNGFLDVSNVRDMGILHDTKANVIEPSDPGKQYIMINLSQTSFRPISINSSMILTISMATESP